MLEFDVKRCTRRCHSSDRELEAGETFYSVLLAAGGEVSRIDFSESAWTGPPDEAIGWWRSQMPEATAKKVNWAPSDVMLHYLEQIEPQPEKQDSRFVLALLMIRRKILRLEDTSEDAEGREVYQLYCPRNEKTYEVVVVNPQAGRVEEIQKELGQLLFADAN